MLPWCVQVTPCAGFRAEGLELVFIGIGMDEAQVTSALEGALEFPPPAGGRGRAHGPDQ